MNEIDRMIEASLLRDLAFAIEQGRARYARRGVLTFAQWVRLRPPVKAPAATPADPITTIMEPKNNYSPSSRKEKNA